MNIRKGIRMNNCRIFKMCKNARGGERNERESEQIYVM